MSYSITSSARASSAGGTLSLAYPLRARSSRPIEARYGRKIDPGGGAVWSEHSNGGACTNIVTPIFPDIANLRCKHISPSSVSVY